MSVCAVGVLDRHGDVGRIAVELDRAGDPAGGARHRRHRLRSARSCRHRPSRRWSTTPVSLAAIVFSVADISVMPDSDENCAICATICVLSTGSNGSWFFSCAVISFRKSAWPSVCDARRRDGRGRGAAATRDAQIGERRVEWRSHHALPSLSVSTISDLAVCMTSTLFWYPRAVSIMSTSSRVSSTFDSQTLPSLSAIGLAGS